MRNLRIREDTAKYLRNLDVKSAYYDPKTRSMRSNPNPDKNPHELDYAGNAFAQRSCTPTRPCTPTQVYKSCTPTQVYTHTHTHTHTHTYTRICTHYVTHTQTHTCIHINAGENFIRYSGDTIKVAQQQLYEFEAFARGQANILKSLCSEFCIVISSWH